MQEKPQRQQDPRVLHERTEYRSNLARKHQPVSHEQDVAAYYDAHEIEKQLGKQAIKAIDILDEVAKTTTVADRLRARQNRGGSYNRDLTPEEFAQEYDNYIARLAKEDQENGIILKQEPVEHESKSGWKGQRTPFDWETEEGRQRIKEGQERAKEYWKQGGQKGVDAAAPEQPAEERKQQAKTDKPEKKMDDRMHVNGRDLKTELKKNIERRFDLDKEPRSVREVTKRLEEVNKEREEKLKREAAQPSQEQVTQPKVTEDPKKQPSETPAPAQPTAPKAPDTDKGEGKKDKTETEPKDENNELENLRAENQTLKEQNQALVKENQDLKGKLSDLEKRVAELEKMLNTKPSAPASPNQPVVPAAPTPAPTPSTEPGQPAPTPEPKSNGSDKAMERTPDEIEAQKREKKRAKNKRRRERQKAKRKEGKQMPEPKDGTEPSEPKNGKDKSEVEDAKDKKIEELEAELAKRNEEEAKRKAQEEEAEAKKKAEAEASKKKEELEEAERKRRAEMERKRLELEAAREQGRQELWNELENQDPKGLKNKLRVLFRPKTDIERHYNHIIRGYVFGGVAFATVATTLLWGALNHAGIIAPWVSWLSEGGKTFPIFPNHSQIIHK